MKRVISALIAVLLVLLPMASAFGEFAPIIRDDAGLLSEEDETAVYQAMEPICMYCTPVFWSVSEGTQDTMEKAEFFLLQQIGNEDGVIFVIDMANRQIAVVVSERMLKMLAERDVQAITDHIYPLASAGDYRQCACEAFNQIGSKMSASMNAGSPGMESPYLTAMKEECKKARTLLSEVPRRGDVKKLAEFRCCIYAIDRINQLSPEGAGGSVFPESTLSSLMDCTGRCFDAFSKGESIEVTLIEMLDQVQVLEDELNGI